MVVIYTRAFNAATTIRATIESILSQTYKDFRYILFNNGSLDETLDIMREYARQDKRIIVLSRNINQMSFASCLDILQFISNNFLPTDYLCNVDADDTYEPCFFEEMVSFCRKKDLDMAFCGYRVLERDSGNVLQEKRPEKEIVMNHDDLPRDFRHFRPYTTDMWAKMFRVSLLDYYLMPERFAVLKSRNHAQQNFIFDALSNSERVGILNKTLLNYYESNIIQKNKRLMGNISHLQARDIYVIMKNFLDGIPADESIRKWNEAYLYAIYCGYIRDTLAVIRLTNALSFSNKVNFVYEIFSYYVTREMLTFDAPEEFYSLRTEAKRQMCADTMDYLMQQPGWEQYRTKIEKVRTICNF